MPILCGNVRCWEGKKRRRQGVPGLPVMTFGRGSRLRNLGAGVSVSCDATWKWNWQTRVWLRYPSILVRPKPICAGLNRPRVAWHVIAVGDVFAKSAAWRIGARMADISSAPCPHRPSLRTSSGSPPRCGPAPPHRSAPISSSNFAWRLVKRVYRYGGRAKRLPDAIVPDMMQCAHAYSGYINDRFWADSVAKVFLGWRTRTFRAADAFRAARYEGPHRFTQGRPRHRRGATEYCRGGVG